MEDKFKFCPDCGKELKRELLAYDDDKPVFVITCHTPKCYISLPILNQRDAEKLKKNYLRSNHGR